MYYGKARGVIALSLQVEEGEIFEFIGPNGAGKTTTIRIMLDIFRPDEGAVEVFGGPMTEVKKRRVGYLPEERGLYRDQKLESVLIYLARLKGLSANDARDRVHAWLERLDLVEHRHKKVQDLSRGMQQKAQLIATLAHDPDLIVVDEPFSGLDPVNTRLVKRIIEEQRQAGKTIIMSTHQMHQVEAMCNRIALINHGRVVLYGDVDEIKRRYSAHAIEIEGRGNFADLPGVLEARRENGVWRLALAAETDPQMVLRALVERDEARIERFELAEPSLEDIFVTTVQQMEA